MALEKAGRDGDIQLVHQAGMLSASLLAVTQVGTKLGQMNTS